MQNELDAVAQNPGLLPYEAFSKLPESRYILRHSRNPRKKNLRICRFFLFFFRRWAKVFSSTAQMGLLLTNNLDHFTSCARYAYRSGHLYAMQMAILAAVQINLVCIIAHCL